MPQERSDFSSTASSLTGSKKLGQPDPESNFAVDLNRGASQALHRERPSRCSSRSAPLHGRSVAASRSTLNSLGSRAERHSESDFVTSYAMGFLSSPVVQAFGRPVSARRPVAACATDGALLASLLFLMEWSGPGAAEGCSTRERRRGGGTGPRAADAGARRPRSGDARFRARVVASRRAEGGGHP